jgi:hypothetical protein
VEPVRPVCQGIAGSDRFDDLLRVLAHSSVLARFCVNTLASMKLPGPPPLAIPHQSAAAPTAPPASRLRPSRAQPKPPRGSSHSPRAPPPVPPRRWRPQPPESGRPPPPLFFYLRPGTYAQFIFRIQGVLWKIQGLFCKTSLGFLYFLWRTLKFI